MKIYYKTSVFTPAVNKYRSLSKEFKKYLKAVMMLVEDAYKLNKKRFIFILAATAAGLGLMGAALGMLLRYVKHLEDNPVVTYYGYTLNFRDGYLLAFVSIFSMLLLIAGAGLVLYGRLKTRDVIVDFHLQALPRVVSKFGWTPPDKIGWINNSVLRTNVRTLFLGDSQKAAMALRRFFEGYQHFLMAFGGVIVLFWLDAVATFFLIIIIIFSLIFFYKINRRASGATRGHENIAGESGRRARVLLDDVSSWPNPNLDTEIFKSITHDGLIKKTGVLLFDRFATRSLSEFLSFALMGVALSFLLMTLGYSALMDETSWAAVVGYIVMLNMVLRAFKNFFKLITEVTRLYPPIRRLYEFNKKTSPPVSNSTIDELSLDFEDNVLTDKKDRKFTLKKGDMAGISAPVSLTRYSVKFFDKLLTVRKKKKKKKKMAKVDLLHSAAIAVPISAIPVPVSLRDLLGLPDNTGADELKKAAGTMAGKIEKAIPLDPDSLIEQNHLKKLSEDALKYFSLISCLVLKRPVIMAHNSLITEGWLAEFQDVLKERILIVCYQGLPEKPASSKSAFKIFLAAAADCTLAAAGSFSFIDKKRSPINALIKERERILISNSDKLIAVSGNEEDDDDE